MRLPSLHLYMTIPEAAILLEIPYHSRARLVSPHTEHGTFGTPRYLQLIVRQQVQFCITNDAPADDNLCSVVTMDA